MTSPQTPELDPDLAAALADDDDDDPPMGFTTTDAEEAMDPEKRAAVEEVRREAQAPKNKGGRPRKKAPPIAEQAPGASQVMGAAPVAVKPRELDMGAIWENIIDRIRDRGLGGADQVTIAVRQIVIGPNREEPKTMAPIDGAAVSGTPTKTPGEDLQDYLERVYQVPSNMGPCKYRLWFQLRGASKQDRNLGAAEIILPSAADIRKRWDAQAQLMRDRERDRDFAGPTRPPMRGYAPASSYSPPAEAPSALAASSSNPRDDFYRAELDRAWAMYDRERREAARLGAQPPDPRQFLPPAQVQQPQMVGGLPEDFDARVARTVAQTLQALGLVPAPGAPPAPPAAPQLTTPVVEKAVTAPMSAAREFFQQMREFRQMEAEMREMFAPEEEPEPPPAIPAVATVVADPEPDESALYPINEQFARFEGDPIMYGKQAEGESTFAYLSRLALGNPKIAGKLLEKGATMLDQSSFGKLVQAFTQMGGPQAQAAAARGNLPPVDPSQQHQNGASGFKPSIG